jgi:uncharacterized small protein (DUF1192 family)
MNQHEEILRKAGAEIRSANINGWGNACEGGADEIARLEESLAKYQECRVHDVDEKEWLRDEVNRLKAQLATADPVRDCCLTHVDESHDPTCAYYREGDL